MKNRQPKRYNDGTFAPKSINKDSPRIIDICINLFSKFDNKPLYVKDIYKNMRDIYNWKTCSRLPTQTIASKLWSDYRFQKVGRNVFKLDSKFYKNRTANKTAFRRA